MPEFKYIENVTDTAYRFSSMLKFMPGETTVVSDADIKSHPVINLLIKNKQLKVVGAKGARKQEVIEEV